APVGAPTPFPAAGRGARPPLARPPAGALGSRLAGGSENRLPCRRTGVAVKPGWSPRFGVPTGSDDKIRNPGKAHVNDEVVGKCHPPGRGGYPLRALRRAEDPPPLPAHIVFGDDLSEALGGPLPSPARTRPPCLRQS